MNGAAYAASVERPTTGLLAARPMPRAAARPTRIPVKLPGPVVTAIRSTHAKSSPAAPSTRAISGINASACPRAIGMDSCAMIVSRSASSTAAEHASSAVSMAKTRMIQIYQCAPRKDRKLARPDLDHVGHEVMQQVLDAVLERGGRGRATRAGALHVQEDDAFLVALEGDVAAVAGHRRAHARFDQVLDGGDGVGVLGVEEFVVGRGR